jgi:hypothetical protein
VRVAGGVEGKGEDGMGRDGWVRHVKTDPGVSRRRGFGVGVERRVTAPSLARQKTASGTQQHSPYGPGLTNDTSRYLLAPLPSTPRAPPRRRVQ